MIGVFVVSIAKPLMVGVYEDDKLVRIYTKDGKTSDSLPSIFEEILDRYEIDELYYVNRPGSFMAIKVAYVFLKSFAIVKGIGFFACDGFFSNLSNEHK